MAKFWNMVGSARQHEAQRQREAELAALGMGEKCADVDLDRSCGDRNLECQEVPVEVPSRVALQIDRRRLWPFEWCHVKIPHQVDSAAPFG